MNGSPSLFGWLWKSAILLVGLGILITACRTRSPHRRAEFDPGKLKQIDELIGRAIAENKLPGGVFWLEQHHHFYSHAYGQSRVLPVRKSCDLDTIFDVASLTKILATTPSIMLLSERGWVELDAPVCRYIPEFAGDGREGITVRHLLTHTSGLRAGLSLTPEWQGYDHAIALACQERLLDPPGKVFRYSDINFVLLGEVVCRMSRLPLNQFAERNFYLPLRMKDTGFLPAKEKRHRTAPTELVQGQYLQGVVHDPLARRMGGVAGHAGLFSTARDVARYARMLLQGGALDGVRVLKPETVKLMTTVQTPPDMAVRRGLGWDIDSGYSRPRGKWFPIGSFGHTGWTGTCLWIDPQSQTFWILLSNRVHPDGKGNVLDLQAALGTLAAEAITGFRTQVGYTQGKTGTSTSADPGLQKPEPANNVSADNLEVLNGIDVLEKQDFAPLKGLRIGLITNHTGRDRQRRSTIDLLRRAPGVALQALFSPEHGLRGNRDELIGDHVDAETGLPVYSLYGQSRQPSAQQLKNLDALVFDIQDIGCRFYTYISTLGNCLEAAAKAHKKFIVLDRVNPINGLVIDGPVLSDKTSFIAWHPIPVRHGMTTGELARMFNAERGFNADLTVIPLAGWRRGAWFDQTGLPWINPSPNMRSLTEAALYPGIGLLETSLSVGRGTDTPFEIIGAPYIDDVKLAGELNRAGLAGVRFVPVRFVPSASVYSNLPCAGVNIILTQRDRYSAVEVGLTLAQVLHRLYPQQFDLRKVNTLLGHPATIEALAGGKSFLQVKALWTSARQDFERRRQPFLLYNP
jgi:uncharacterized protein YbbC (DUF1343 family)/CubicO group peptidase (beta-lactamase class C family)